MAEIVQLRKPVGAPPSTERELLIECLRLINRTSGVLNEVASMTMESATPTEDKINDLMLRRFSDLSGVPHFMAANQLNISLPADLSPATPTQEE